MSGVAREWREIPGRYNLKGTKCGNCGRIFFPARSFCPVCRRASAGKMEEYALSRTGKVFSFSIVHEAPESNILQKPYAVAMIETDDGVKITGQLVDVEFDKISIGMPVRVVLRKLDCDGESGVIRYGYKFVPAE